MIIGGEGLESLFCHLCDLLSERLSHKVTYANSCHCMSPTPLLTPCGKPVHVCVFVTEISAVIFSINEREYYLHFMYAK